MSPSPAPPSTASVSACAIDVAVRVAGEPARVVEANAAEHERHAVRERVRVDAGADPELSQAAPAVALRPSNTRDSLAPCRAGEREGPVEVAADVRGHVCVGGGRDRHAARDTGAQEHRVGVELADRLVEAGGRDLDRDARLGRRVGELQVELREHRRLGQAPKIFARSRCASTSTEPLAASSETACDVRAPDLLDRVQRPEPRLLVDRDAVDPVHRAEQEVPRVAGDRLGEPLLRAAPT